MRAPRRDDPHRNAGEHTRGPEASRLPEAVARLESALPMRDGRDAGVRPARLRLRVFLVAVRVSDERVGQSPPDPAGSGPEAPPVSTIDDLQRVMAKLRDPVEGCPWDLEQSFDTIAPHTIEEAHEVADAIARRDDAALVDELGDLLFQVVFYAQMGAESGRFRLADVIDAIVDKMIRRHPHVFGDARVDDADAQTRAWEALKEAERPASASVMDAVPKGIAPTLRARKLQRRAASVGFDWASAREVLPKLREEVEEMALALRSAAGRGAVEGELGDLLFTCINVARHLGVDADEALRRTNGKFERRFRRMEKAAAESGRSLRDSTPAELERYWEEAKALES